MEIECAFSKWHFGRNGRGEGRTNGRTLNPASFVRGEQEVHS